MLAAIPASQTYSVEVSGWDNNEDFFVEKTELHFGPSNQESTFCPCGRSLPVRSCSFG